MSIPLEVIELTKIYNKKEAVKNISFKIKKKRDYRNPWSKWLWKDNHHRNDIGIVKTFKW